jgi:hypothetical protein
MFCCSSRGWPFIQLLLPLFCIVEVWQYAILVVAYLYSARQGQQEVTKALTLAVAKHGGRVVDYLTLQTCKNMLMLYLKICISLV